MDDIPLGIPLWPSPAKYYFAHAMPHFDFIEMNAV
jgi:hypothetical protein